MRHFENRLIANRYDTGRARFHDAMIEAFMKTISIERKWEKVLDIACGTGHSSQPLLQYSREVVGIDISEMMIEIARQNVSGVEFIVGSAEQLPKKIGKVDAVFVANGFHWLNKDAFLKSVNDILTIGGWIVIYGIGSPKIMKSNPDYTSWYTQEYWKRYPNPKRVPGRFTDFVDNSSGRLGSYGKLESEISVDLSPAELCAMITTQSNIHQAIEGGENIDAIDEYLESVVPAYFQSSTETFVFRDRIEYAQRI